MDILMSLHKKWTKKILDGTKTLEFRNNIGKEFKIGSKIYIYETSKNNGSKMVVGEFTIKDIKSIEKSKLGCYPFLVYYCENIIKNNEYLKAVLNIYNIKMTHYDNAIKAYYIFQPEILQNLEKTDKLPNLLSMLKEEYLEYESLQKKSIKLVEDCDKWLSSIGYYNEYNESSYKNYIEITNPIKYENPLPLNSFLNKNNKEINSAPQSWLYCTKKSG